jgi:hypothetical protein
MEMALFKASSSICRNRESVASCGTNWWQADMSTLTLYEDSTRGDRLEIPLPLVLEADLGRMHSELGLPDHLDLSNYQTGKAIVLAWAARHASQLKRSDGKGVYARRPLPVAFFGGMGFRMHCPSANQPGSPFSRTLNDLDLVTLKKSGPDLVKLLRELDAHFGTGYGFWVTRPDRVYNGFREGRRYRLTTVNTIDEASTPLAGKLDIMTESMNFCHDVAVKADVEQSEQAHFSLSLETLILLKTQFIKLASRVELEATDFRVLGEYDDQNYVIGMEPKDARDVCGALFDHDVAQGGGIDAERVARLLASDWGLHRTVLMNLQNLSSKLGDLLEGFGATTEQTEQVADRLNALLERLTQKDSTPRPPLIKMRNQWWRTVED